MKQSFLVRSQTPELRDQFIAAFRKLYRAKYVNYSLRILSMSLDGREYTLFFDEIHEDYALNIFILNEEDYAIDDDGKPSVTLVIRSGIDKNTKSHDNDFVFFDESISTNSVRYIFTYAVMLNDCYPFGLHLKKEIKGLCLEYLRRFFRSLDYDFDGKIFLSDLSKQNKKVFGVDFSDNDYCSIFQIINGSTPLYVENVKTLAISFENFMTLMQHLVNEGYSHVVYKLMMSTDFQNYFGKENEFIFTEPVNLNINGYKFLSEVYNDLGDNISYQNVLALFSLQGGPPPRFTNLRKIDMDDWINIWKDWFRLEPAEAAYHLLAFGFPMSKLIETLGYQNQKSSSLIPIIATGGIALIGVCSFLYLKFKNRRF